MIGSQKRLRFALAPFLLGSFVLMLDCASLEPIAAGTCGNGVVEAQEDCDTFPAGQCGAPSATDSKCRLLCGKQASGAVLTCPDGWGCSVSGFCRQPTGTFDTASEPVSAGVTTMLVGDFDGDGRKDVLGSSGPTSKGRIHYFNDTSAPQVVALPGVLAAPTIRDFDGDGRSDIAFGYSFRGSSVAPDGSQEPSFSGGYAILLGQSDRAVVTKLFPSFTAPNFDALLVPLARTGPGAVPPSALANPLLAAATVQVMDGTRLTLLTSIDGDFTDRTSGRIFSKVLPGTVSELAGDPLSANLFDLATASTCGEIVTAYTSGRVLIHSPCKRVGTPGGLATLVAWSQEDPKEITIPGETLTRVFVADINNDTHGDLIVGSTSAGGKPKVRVAYGDGLALKPLVDAPPELGEVPLAAGFLDADDLIDLVIPSGILLSMRPGAKGDGGGDPDGGGAPPSWISVPVPTKKWTVARIGDVNRDGLADVIGASENEPDIDVLEGTGGFNMPPFSIATTGSVTKLVVGDFDLDRNGDIAFVQARPASAEREVAIAYGRALTMPPESPKPAGRLDGIRQVFVSDTGLSLTSAPPTTGTDLPAFSVALLLSSAERQPVAPLLFANPATGATTRSELTTRALVAAPNNTNEVDLIGLVAQSDYTRTNGQKKGDATYGVWVAPGTGPLAFNSPQLAIPLTNLFAVDKSTDSFLVQMTSGDLDGDKNAEIIALAPDDTGKGAGMYVIHSGPQSGLPVQVPIPERAVPGGMRAQLVDIDGDGHDDLVSVLRDTTNKRLEVNVFFGDGKANLAIPGVAIKLPIPKGAADDDYAALGFTSITTAGGAVGTAGGARHELAIITPRHLFRVFVRPDRTADVVDATAPFGDIRYGSAVVAGDFDGDGVDDLAIADQGSIRISRQKARLQ